MRKTVATAIAVVLSGIFTLSSTPANAAPSGVKPMDADGCNGNVCMYLSDVTNGEVYIKAWAYRYDFDGNFDLTGPGGLYRHGPTRRWYARKVPNVTEWYVPAVVGRYCVSGWRNGERIGYPCLSLG